MQHAKVLLLLALIAAAVVISAKDGDWGTFALLLFIIIGLAALLFIRKRANPNLLEEYVAKAQAVVGADEKVLVASLMAPQDDSADLIWTTLKRSTQGRFIGSVFDSGADLGSGTFADLGATSGMLSGMHEARKRNAEKQGLTPVVLVAVTAEHIHILDWARPDRLPYVASSETTIAATRILVTLNLHTTSAVLKRNGLSARFFLGDSASGVTLALQGSLSPASPDAKPTKLLAQKLGVSTK